MEDARAAALVVGNPEVFLGSDFIHGSKIKVQLLSMKCPEAQPVVGFRLLFPFEPSLSKGHCYSELGEDSRQYAIIVKFPLGQFSWGSGPIPETGRESIRSRLWEGQDISTLRGVNFTIKEDCHISVDGFGKPFVGSDTEISSWLNLNSPIHGSKSLFTLFSLRLFHFIVPDEDSMRKFLIAFAAEPASWQGYPFGKE